MENIHCVEIIKIEKHPNANKLNVCFVTDGQKETQVVCGASNVRVGLKTILAPVGSKTPAGLEIKAAQLRGIDSFGMLCSAKDLAVSTEAGIVDLPSSIDLATSLEAIDKNLLSSTPWYSFKQVEELRLQENNKVQVFRENFGSNPGRLVSETFFIDGEYRYRNY